MFASHQGEYCKCWYMQILNNFLFYTQFQLKVFNVKQNDKICFYVFFEEVTIMSSLLPHPKLCLGERYCFTRGSLFVFPWFCDSVILSVFLWLCDQYFSKKFWPISIKYGSKLGYHETKVMFDFEKNHLDWTHPSQNERLKSTWNRQISVYLK